MMIYLTGASAPLTKSGGVSPQHDTNRSLGGYISSSPIPNSMLNGIFDFISAYTLEKRNPETLGFAIVNKFDYPVKDVELKIVTDEGNLADFKIGAVSVDKESMTMESIPNRYSQPISVEFFDASFYRAGVTVKIERPALEGEQIVFYPMNVIVEVDKSGLEGTWEAIFEAFNEDDVFLAKRITADTFRIERRDETVISVPVNCSFITTGSSLFSFDGKLRNKADNSVLLSDTLEAGECIGIWLQRRIKKTKSMSNEELLENYKNQFNYPTIEEVELIVSYNLVEDEEEENV